MGAGSRHRSVARQHRSSSSFNTLSRSTFALRLHDRRLQPIPQAYYLVRAGDARYRGRADGDGWLEERIPLSADECTVYWSVPREGDAAPATEEDFEFTTQVYLRIDDSDRDEALRRRLHNAGFSYEPGDEDAKRGAVMAFQMARSDQGLEPTGDADDTTHDVLKRLHDEADLGPEEAEEGG
ncbi:MAG: hypothetical protein AB1714_26865 [Acidobacteriota bacterium]